MNFNGIGEGASLPLLTFTLTAGMKAVVQCADLLPSYLPVYHRSGDIQLLGYFTEREIPHPNVRSLFAISACLVSILKKVSAWPLRFHLGYVIMASLLRHIKLAAKNIQEFINIH